MGCFVVTLRTLFQNRRHHVETVASSQPQAYNRRSMLYRDGGGSEIMHFIIHCLDRPDAVADRLKHYEAHKAYLAAASVRTVISGPLLADDKETMIGSCFLIESDDQEAVFAFNREDPFYKAGVWQDIKIHPFSKRVDNRPES
jgi:uncharacterized protein